MTQDIVKTLNSLIQLDIDAFHAYQQAVGRVDVPLVKEQLSRFRDDHERHIRELSAKVRELDEEPPKPSPDLKGYLIEGFTALRSVTGTEGALKAMKTNEQLTNRRYDEGRKIEASADIHALLVSNWEDEKRHLEFVEQCLRDKIWEK